MSWTRSSTSTHQSFPSPNIMLFLRCTTTQIRFRPHVVPVLTILELIQKSHSEIGLRRCRAGLGGDEAGCLHILEACWNPSKSWRNLPYCNCTQYIQVPTLEVTMRHGAVMAAFWHDMAVHCTFGGVILNITKTSIFSRLS